MLDVDNAGCRCLSPLNRHRRRFRCPAPRRRLEAIAAKPRPTTPVAPQTVAKRRRLSRRSRRSPIGLGAADARYEDDGSRLAAGRDLVAAARESFKVSGLSASEIETRLADELRRTYVRDPQVSVQVEEIESHPISVVGAVAEPGTFQVRGPMHLLGGALARQRRERDRWQSRARHARGQQPRRSISISSNCWSLVIRRLNVVVNPGDVVKVTSASMIYIVGEFKKPGAFPMPRGDRAHRAARAGVGRGPRTV